MNGSRLHIFDDIDRHRIDRIIDEFERAQHTDFHHPGLRDVRFSHVGMLVIPTDPDPTQVSNYFRERGFNPGPSVPSVLVKARLCSRYSLRDSDLEVAIVRFYPSPDAQGPCVEIFLVTSARSAGLARQEREIDFERHLAVTPSGPGELRYLRALERLHTCPSLAWEQSGYNGAEGTRGSTVNYFVSNDGPIWGSYRRIELYGLGDFRSNSTERSTDHVRVADAYRSFPQYSVS